MEANTILTANILDIVFDGKNKEYGAYNLRKTYNNRLELAFAITAILMSSLFFLNSIFSTPLKNERTFFVPADVTINATPKDKQPEVKPQIKPQTNVATAQYTKPIIVKQTDVIPPAMDEVFHSAIDVKTKAGIRDSSFNQNPVIIGSNVMETVKEDPVEGFGPIEIEAEFPGGQSAWKNYLQRNLNANVPAENAAPGGTYTVVVKFIVSNDGNISDIQCENDPGYGMGDEAKKIISKGPKWKPAIQNGHYVKAYRSQPVTFVVEEP